MLSDGGTDVYKRQTVDRVSEVFAISDYNIIIEKTVFAIKRYADTSRATPHK